MAAWELLWAVNELFPDVVQELLSIRDEELRPDLEVTEPSDDERYDAAESESAGQFASDWLRKHRLFSPLMLDVALEFATGQVPQFEAVPLRIDSNGDVRFAPAISANPRSETLSAFLSRAKAHYAEVERFCSADTSEARPRFKTSSPFRYLAAHLVGGYTIAEIAHEDTPFPTSVLPAAEQQTISEQVRAAAEAVGIVFSKRRGPRKGARRHPRRLLTRKAK